MVITSIASTVDKPIHDLSILSLTTKPLEAINFRLMNGLLDRRLEDIQEDAFHLQTALLGDQAHVDPAK